MFSLKDINKAALESFDLLPDDAYLRISVLLCLYSPRPGRSICSTVLK